MCVPKSWHILVFNRKSGEFVDDRSELWEEEVEAIAEEDKVSVILNKMSASRITWVGIGESIP